MTRDSMASQPMTPQAAAVAFLAMALAARVNHNRQHGLVLASVIARPDKAERS